MKRILVLLLALFLIPTVAAVGSNTTLGFAGALQNSSTGEYLSDVINITLNISESSSCVNDVIYSETFEHNVSGGVFSILAGYYEEHLNLEYGRAYFSCYRIYNGSFSERFGADPFTSGKGLINASNIIISTTYNATSINVSEGTLDDGSLASVQSIDNNWFNVSEVAGANPLLIYVNFTGVDKFGNILLRTRYDGGLGHEIDVSTWNYDNSAWESHGEITDQSTITELVIDVLDSSDHVSGGLVQMRFNHVQNGVGTHDFRIDYVALQEGFTTVTSSVHDSFLGRDDSDNHPWAFPTDASRDITKDTTFLEGLNISDKNVSMWQDATGFHIQTYAGASDYGDIILDPQGQDLHTDNIVPLGPVATRQLGTSANDWLGIWLRTVSFDDTNTQIWEDASSNLTFKDAVAGTWTLLQLSSWIGTATSNLNMMGYNITNVSRLGIGLTNPLQSLHVNSSAVLFDNSAPGSTDVRIQTLAGSDRLLTFREGATLQWTIRSDNFLSPLLEPLVFNSNGANNVLILHQDGKIGINTTNSENTVNIDGGINATKIIYTNSTERVCTSENGLCNDSTKEFFIPVSWGTGTEGNTGDFYRWNLAVESSQTAHINFYVPQDVTSITNAVVIIIVGGAGGGLQITPNILTDFGAASETYNTHSTAGGAIGIPGLTAGDITELPIITTNMAAGDYVGVQVVESGLALFDVDFDVIGVRFEYT